MSIQFGKDKTAIVKGFAIVFMIVLHCFCGSDWYDTELPMNQNEGLLDFMESLKICVGIFTFMVGYGYAFSKNKDISYSLHHIKALLIPYWIVLFGLTVPFCLDYIESKSLLLNVFGIMGNLSWVNWFIYFYIWSMVIMPFVGRLIDTKPYVFGALAIVCVFCGEVVIHQFVPAYKNNYYLQALFNCFMQTPTMILGYIFSRKQLFLKIPIIEIKGFTLKSLVVLAIVIIMLVILFVRSKVGAILGFNLDFFYAPAMIACILYLFNWLKMPVLSKVMTSLGNNSVYMWFLHGLFFTDVVRSFYQPFIMVSTNLWIISLWTIFLSYVCSVIIKKVVEY